MRVNASGSYLGYLTAKACRIRPAAWLTLSRRCVRRVLSLRGFPLVEAHPSTDSAGTPVPLFARFDGVGSEEAPVGAGLRPPLKRLVQFSRKPLSQRCLIEGSRNARRIDPVNKSPRAMMSGSFTQGTYPRHGPYSLIPLLAPTTSANRLPRHTRPPLARSPGFRRA